MSRIGLVRDYAVPISVGVIANILGVAKEDRIHFQEWTDAFLARLGSMPNETDALEAAVKTIEMQHYIVERINERRAERRDALLSDLVNGRSDDGEALSLEELVTVLMQLISAGNDTTRALISSVMLGTTTVPTGALVGLIGGSDQP